MRAAHKVLRDGDGECRPIPFADGAFRTLSQRWATVRLLVHRPKDLTGPAPVLLHVHGGGYVLGSPEIMDARNRQWCQAMRCIVVSVDYRLAPETPFPGGLEDCYAAEPVGRYALALALADHVRKPVHRSGWTRPIVAAILLSLARPRRRCTT